MHALTTSNGIRTNEFLRKRLMNFLEKECKTLLRCRHSPLFKQLNTQLYSYKRNNKNPYNDKLPFFTIPISCAIIGTGKFDELLHPIDTTTEQVHIVDAGLAFNLPFPAVIRPQRKADLIISFEFSARSADDSPPFEVSSNI